MGQPFSAGHDDASDEQGRPRRLDSWKEIATHFRRDERTVRRWERTEGLPVHRHRHRARGSVYAFADELDRWQAARSTPAAANSPHTHRSGPWLIALFAGLGVAGLAVAVHRAGVGCPPSPATNQLAARSAGASPSRQLPEDPEVRDAFLVARHQLSRRTGLRRQAREHLELVVARAPDFAEAHALLGEAYVRQALYDPPDRGEAWAKAEAATRRALVLESDLAAAHSVLGRIQLLRDWDWAPAEAEIKRAIELDPNDLDARSTHAWYLRSAGRLDGAIAERQAAQQADPLNPQWLVFLGDEYTFARRYADAERSYRRALEVERDYRPAIAGLADVTARAGRLVDASMWQLQHLRMTGQDQLAEGYDETCRRDGPAAAARWLDRQRLLYYQREPERHAWDLAYTHARLGEREEALRFLELACQRRDSGLLQAHVDPDVDPLRDDPRFQAILARVGPAR